MPLHADVTSVHIQCILQPPSTCYKGVEGEVSDAGAVRLVESQRALNSGFKVNAMNVVVQRSFVWLETSIEGRDEATAVSPIDLHTNGTQK